MIERLIRLLLHRRWVILAIAALITLLGAMSLPRLSFDNTVESWFLEGDPDLVIYDHFTATFKADQIIVVGLFAEDIFAADVLAAVERISAGAASLRFADRVQSVTRSPVAAIRFDNAGFREAVLESPLLRQQFLSPALDATAIVIHYARQGSNFDDKHEFVEALRSIAADAVVDSDARFAISGAPVIGEAGQARNKQDLRILVPVMIAVIIIIAFGIFQSVTMTLLPLGTSAIALILAYGLMAAVGWKMTMISVILIPLILAVGVAHAIHIIDRYRLLLERGQSNETAVANSVTQLLRPCFYAGITTVIGLLSLLVSNLAPVHEFALTAATGVAVSFVASVTVLPVFLSWRGGHIRQTPTVARKVVRTLLAAVHGAATGHPRKIVVVGLAAAIAFAWLATRIETGLDTMSWIRHDDPIRVETQLIDRAFGGALSLEFLLSSPAGDLDEPAALRRMEAFQTWLVASTRVGHSLSMADLVKESARVARDAGENGYSLPRTRVLTDELVGSLRRTGSLEAWATPQFTEARIAARVPLASAQEIIAEIPAIRRQLDATFSGSGIDVHMTGQAVLAGKMQSHMLDSQLRSFAVALAVVSLVMIALLRSSFLGLLAMIPNLLPIAVGLGAMTLLGIKLSPATVMIAAVALGIVVDDTVHLMTAFERRLRRTGVVGEAVRSSLLDVGQPVLITSILLATGFATLVLGSFLPTREVGGIVALTVVAALVTDIVFMPAVLRSVPRRWLVSGNAPQDSVSK
jgi:predicted RND superfamily exporter protein